jgi:Ribonuclease G/E
LFEQLLKELMKLHCTGYVLSCKTLGIYSAQAKKIASSLIFEELPLHQRIVRDLASESTSKICIDSREIHAKLKDFIEFVPELKAA